MLFAALTSHRDRASVAFWVSTGARQSELLGACQGDADPGQQLITVVRKGSRAAQQLPPRLTVQRFVWLRLYQQQMHGRIPAGRRRPLWWTLRQPLTALSYHAAHRMFEWANALLGANWTLHDLRHSATHRMARDPALPLADVQWIFGPRASGHHAGVFESLGEGAVRELRAHQARQAPRRAGAGTAGSGIRRAVTGRAVRPAAVKARANELASRPGCDRADEREHAGPRGGTSPAARRRRARGRGACWPPPMCWR